MTSRLTACLLLVGAVAACDAGTGGQPTPPSNPLGGTETTDKTGYEPPGGSEVNPGHGSTIAQLCAYDCMRFEGICPGSSGGTDCTSSCTSVVTMFPGCEAQFQAYFACVASASVTCTNGILEISGCEGAENAVNNCIGVSGGTGTGGASGGGSGSAGVSGTAPPR
jgi:hypothetical protein